MDSEMSFEAGQEAHHTGFDNIKQENDVAVENQELPFYLIRPTPPEEELNGSTNLILHNERQYAFNKYCCKKVKEPLSAFLPDFPGNIDTTSFFTSGEESKETSTLSSLLDPSLQGVNKTINSLTVHDLQSFRLYTGLPLADKYMVMVQTNLPSTNEPSAASSSKKSKKSKRSSNEGEASGEKRKKKKEKKKKKDKDKEKKPSSADANS